MIAMAAQNPMRPPPEDLFLVGCFFFLVEDPFCGGGGGEEDGVRRRIAFPASERNGVRGRWRLQGKGQDVTLTCFRRQPPRPGGDRRKSMCIRSGSAAALDDGGFFDCLICTVSGCCRPSAN